MDILPGHLLGVEESGKVRPGGGGGGGVGMGGNRLVSWHVGGQRMSSFVHEDVGGKKPEQIWGGGERKRRRSAAVARGGIPAGNGRNGDGWEK